MHQISFFLFTCLSACPQTLLLKCWGTDKALLRLCSVHRAQQSDSRPQRHFLTLCPPLGWSPDPPIKSSRPFDKDWQWCPDEKPPTLPFVTPPHVLSSSTLFYLASTVFSLTLFDLFFQSIGKPHCMYALRLVSVQLLWRLKKGIKCFVWPWQMWLSLRCKASIPWILCFLVPFAKNQFVSIW